MERRVTSHTEEEEMNQRRRLLTLARKGDQKATDLLFELYQVRVFSGDALKRKKLPSFPVEKTPPPKGKSVSKKVKKSETATPSKPKGTKKSKALEASKASGSKKGAKEAPKVVKKGKGSPAAKEKPKKGPASQKKTASKGTAVKKISSSTKGKTPKKAVTVKKPRHAKKK